MTKISILTGRVIKAVALLFALLAMVTAQGVLASEQGQKAVLVTGATSGIGLRMAEVLSEHGFFVYAGARKPEDIARLNRIPNVKAVRLDVTIQQDIDAAVEWVRAEGRGLFGLINNAGVAVVGPLIELSEEDMQFQLDVNLFGPYRVTRAFADLLIESEGRIMTTGSIAGILAGPFSGAYSMSKHGVEAYTDSLAAELARFNVQVAVVEPGNYKSQIVASMVKRMQAGGYSAEGSRYGSMLNIITGPLDRSQFKVPDDVALAALDFMTSDSPKRRYMVVPSQSEAEMTIRQAILELVQLNEGQQFTYSRDALVGMLDEALGQADPASADGAAQSPAVGLHQGAVQGNIEAVRQHIRDGADLNATEPMGGSTALISAATFGQTEVAKALIEAGADVDLQNNDGSTALLTAALFCRTEIVAALLANGADKNIANSTGSTPLDVVSGPFNDMVGIYDYLSTVLGPFGLKLDYGRLEATRPAIAEMLR